MVFRNHNFIWCYLLVRKRSAFHANVYQALLVGPSTGGSIAFSGKVAEFPSPNNSVEQEITEKTEACLRGQTVLWHVRDYSLNADAVLCPCSSHGLWKILRSLCFLRFL